MKNISFVIHNENGLDARLAGQLVKECIACEGQVAIRCGQKRGNGKTIFNVISLKARKGDTVELELSGGQEEADAERLAGFARAVI